nr:uncharacterized protein LOC121116438 [Lepeophtheirus salmonis]
MGESGESSLGSLNSPKEAGAWKGYYNNQREPYPSYNEYYDDYYNEENHDYLYKEESSRDTYDPWKEIYKDGRYSHTHYYNPIIDAVSKEKNSLQRIRQQHPFAFILNAVSPFYLLAVLSVPLILGLLYYLLVVNGPTPVVRARINDLIDNLDNENDIPTALYYFFKRMKKLWLES